MYQYRAKVLRWIDGDTVDLEIDLGFRVRLEQRARLAGLNTPEIHSKDAEIQSRAIRAAMLCNRLAFPSTFVTINSKKSTADDKYGRWLVEIVIGDGTNLNQELLKQGLAKPWDGQGSAPV